MLIALFVIGQLSKSRSFQLFGTIVPRIETSQKVVALTFDDGPTPAYTPVVLSVLRQKRVKATFFLIGEAMKENMDQAKAIVADGHELGNHTYHHLDMTLADEATAKREVEPSDAEIRKAGYNGEILFRPPGCKKLIGLPLYLAKHGRTTVTWDVEPESYPEVAADPNRITAYVLEKARPGSIILLHVMYRSRETTRQALPHLIDGLRERGFRFVTVSELITMGKGPPPSRVEHKKWARRS
jgi:peptidoglycan/xylan/chitin deacetylase (PgdA/CDA1 family)